MKNESEKLKEAKELRMKTEEDFYKEVVDTKHTNVILTNHIEIIEEERKMLENKLKSLKKKRTNYVVKVEKTTKEEFSGIFLHWKQQDEEEVQEKLRLLNPRMPWNRCQ